MRVEELGRLAEFKVGGVGPVLVSVFQSSATLAGLDLLEKVQDAFVRAQGTIFPVTVVVGDRLTAPAGGVREAAARLQTRFDPATVGAAVVLEQKGVAAVIARSFLAGLSLIQRGQKPTRTFRSVSEAIGWARSMPGQLPAVVAMADLAAAIDAFADELRSK